MSRYRLWGTIALAPILAAALAMAGCGGGDKAATESGGGARTAEGGGKRIPAKDRTPIEGKGTATLKGRVTLAGGNPPPPRDLKPEMEKQGDKARCLDPQAVKEGLTQSEEWIVGADKGVKNVVVFLKAPAGKYFKVPDNLRHRSGDKVQMEQPYCAFQPHILAINPTCWDAEAKKQEPTGQEFTIINNATMLHNTAWKGDDRFNPGANEKLSPKQVLNVRAFPCKENEVGKEDILRITCDVHKWMYARVVVLDHPYYDVTKADGSYEIKNAPAGAEVEVVRWHESMGDSTTTNKVPKETVTLNPGENTKNFTISVP